jgi:hypothetical protein
MIVVDFTECVDVGNLLPSNDKLKLTKKGAREPKFRVSLK